MELLECYKYHPNVSIQKCKIHLVAQGFNQRPRSDYTKTFGPIVKPTAIRIILSLGLPEG